MESLESRTLFDLVPSIVDASLPASLIPTLANHDRVVVDLTNTGATTITTPYTLTIYASSDQTLGGGDTQLASLSTTLHPLHAGKATELKFSLSDFPNLANGDYFILAKLSAAVNAGDVTVASNNSITVTDPFIDLTVTDAYLGPASLNVGHKSSVAVTVTNNGNIRAKNILEIDSSLSVNADGSSPGGSSATMVHLNLKPGHSKVYRLSRVVAVDFAPGAYYYVASIDPGNTFDETDTSNNTAVTPTAQTLVDPFPNVMGSFNGFFHVTDGPDIGLISALDFDFVSENQLTGSVSGTGDSNGAFTFSGKIKTTGQLVAVAKGTVSGAKTTFTGTFSGGTFSGTFKAGKDRGTFAVS